MQMLELFAFLICEVYFKEGTEVATNEVWAFWIELGNPNPSPWQMVSFTSRTNFCAAPIIGTGPVGRTAMCPFLFSPWIYSVPARPAAAQPSRPR